MQRMRKRFLDCSKMTLEEAESYGNGLAEQQRDVMFQLGDLARYCKARWPDTWQQVFPEWLSPGLIDRVAGVAKAYPKEDDRQAEATYTIYMRNANHPDRIQRVQATVDAGLTSDESRKQDQQEKQDANRPRWLLAVDVNYHLHRHWYSGAGVEAAVRVSEWVQRTVERLQAKGLTDVVCCFDAPNNFRKQLTKDWEDKYKDRPKKDTELVQQLQLVRELLEGHGFACVSQDTFEADDVMASYARQFPGRVTLLSQDKDVRQCLSEKCNILLDIAWNEDETSGEMLPEYKWLSANGHTEATGVQPSQWAEFQAIMGDTVDGVKGAPGIGEKGAKDLIQEFGNLDAVLKAAREDDERIKPKKRAALLELAERLDVVRQLVTLQTDCEIPTNTRI